MAEATISITVTHVDVRLNWDEAKDLLALLDWLLVAPNETRPDVQLAGLLEQMRSEVARGVDLMAGKRDVLTPEAAVAQWAGPNLQDIPRNTDFTRPNDDTVVDVLANIIRELDGDRDDAVAVAAAMVEHGVRLRASAYLPRSGWPSGDALKDHLVTAHASEIGGAALLALAMAGDVGYEDWVTRHRERLHGRNAKAGHVHTEWS